MTNSRQGGDSPPSRAEIQKRLGKVDDREFKPRDRKGRKEPPIISSDEDEKEEAEGVADPTAQPRRETPARPNDEEDDPYKDYPTFELDLDPDAEIPHDELLPGEMEGVNISTNDPTRALEIQAYIGNARDEKDAFVEARRNYLAAIKAGARSRDTHRAEREYLHTRGKLQRKLLELHGNFDDKNFQSTLFEIFVTDEERNIKRYKEISGVAEERKETRREEPRVALPPPAGERPASQRRGRNEDVWGEPFSNEQEVLAMPFGQTGLISEGNAVDPRRREAQAPRAAGLDGDISYPTDIDERFTPRPKRGRTSAAAEPPRRERADTPPAPPTPPASLPPPVEASPRAREAFPQSPFTFGLGLSRETAERWSNLREAYRLALQKRGAEDPEVDKLRDQYEEVVRDALFIKMRRFQSEYPLQEDGTREEKYKESLAPWFEALISREQAALGALDPNLDLVRALARDSELLPVFSTRILEDYNGEARGLIKALVDSPIDRGHIGEFDSDRAEVRDVYNKARFEYLNALFDSKQTGSQNGLGEKKNARDRARKRFSELLKKGGLPEDKRRRFFEQIAVEELQLENGIEESMLSPQKRGTARRTKGRLFNFKNALAALMAGSVSGSAPVPERAPSPQIETARQDVEEEHMPRSVVEARVGRRGAIGAIKDLIEQEGNIPWFAGWRKQVIQNADSRWTKTPDGRVEMLAQALGFLRYEDDKKYDAIIPEGWIIFINNRGIFAGPPNGRFEELLRVNEAGEVVSTKGFAGNYRESPAQTP